MNRIVVGICAAALAGMIGFGSGAILTRPKREETKATIAAIRAEADSRISLLQRNLEHGANSLRIAQDKIAYLEKELINAEERLEDTDNELSKAKEKLGKIRLEVLTELLAQTAREQQNRLYNLLESLKYGMEGVDIISLKGLKNVEVSVILPPTEKTMAYGLTKQVLLTDTELELRRSGIKVLTGTDEFEIEESGFLTIEVLPEIDERLGAVFAQINLSLHQPVLLFRDPSIICMGTTWMKRNLTPIMKLDNSLRSVREKNKEYVDVFINNYLTVNSQR